MLVRMDTQEAETPTDDQVDEAVDILKLVADPTRLRILWALLHGEHSVNLLADHVGAQPAAVSQHLAKLRLARLVRTRREGTHVFYLAQNDHVRRIVEEALFHADHVVHGVVDRDEESSHRRVTRTERPA
jgi:ArsR family transcriptional regulator, zinc-responsive transcriptional repressor